MEKLIKAYLKHIRYYLADGEILSIHSVFDGHECLYEIEVRNELLALGSTSITVSVSDLLVFLFERQA